ncbi:aminodeoxychorismate synthase component I [Sporomusa acidovorans]|uniref:aminodeoxychorismate synthase n=1 Tax=Sporomusa acidovorans (strain ATCC 49682 / DSM 3132 / Mol) TaxID=1123286 RepID=A0ABZ3J1P8_SPOA4|nr:aminodeoxychorismate synthase component I [Sporomusa acidovorans]OZC22455.1 aminodeoxychorismate synthase component 1 [Sporomusa acidovorans DSM 3132]SDE74460.1 aminodeoxychorismate synthase, subunit I [Sporomusa acidovorans]
MNPIPMIREIAVTVSPAEVFALFAQQPYSVFLDSGKDSNGVGRYSFIARDPFLVFSSKGQAIHIEEKGGCRNFAGNPFAELKRLLAIYKTEKVPGLPPLTGGVIGYFGYDMGYLLENIPDLSIDDLNNPDCMLGFYDTVLIFDHHTNKTLIAANGFPERDELCRRARAENRINELVALLAQAKPLPEPEPQIPAGDYQSNFTRKGHCDMVQKGIDYIAAGDIFQVNLTQRFNAKVTVPPFELYRYLRHINPAPFASYLNFGEVIVASASPERYMLVTDRMVETRPIKGTRPRGQDPESDRLLREELAASEKDRAELVMIIDLERNDLGRVCEFGSVRVPDLIRLEEYATVFHLVSTVVGKLSPGKDVIDLITASFPGGSITGAPKVRAMEIIDELEQVRRGIYTGSIGYIDFNGDADLNIVIRTFVIKGDRAYYQVGGGIIADSVPELEYEESLDKARALMRALGYQV